MKSAVSPLVIPTLLLMLSGCGMGSLYGPAYYDETSLGENLRRVTFKGGITRPPENFACFGVLKSL